MKRMQPLRPAVNRPPTIAHLYPRGATRSLCGKPRPTHPAPHAERCVVCLHLKRGPA